MFAELSAIWRGLRLAWDLGHRFIILESDSKAAMDLIEDVHNSYFHPHGTILFSLGSSPLALDNPLCPYLEGRQ